jgi:monoamine oxidase
MNDNNESNKNNNNDKKNKRRVGIGIALLLLTCMALGLGLGLRGESDNHSEKSSSSNEASANDIADTAEDQEVASTTTNATATTYDVIIIGAGWAGIRALEILLLQNITNVLLLESTSVIGGRCRSYNADGSVNNPNYIANIDDDLTTAAATTATTTYNVGADWLYANTDMSNVLLDSGYLDGISNTYPASDTAIPMGLLTGRYYRQTTSSSSSSSIVDDDTTSDDGITTTVTAEAMSQQSSSNLMNDIWGDFHTLRSNELNDMFGMSYDDAINYYIDNNEWLYDYTANTDDDDASTTTTSATARMAIDFLNFMKTSSEIENSGDSSALDITDINFVPPGYTSESIYMGGIGFGNVVAQYAQKYISYIMLNSRVITIDSSEENTPDVTVVSYVTDTNDDDDNSEGGSTTTTTTTVQAKTVLVTVSLGVLKSRRIQFIPPLPENKRTIINSMGYGTLNKCILSWKSNDAIVWPVDESWFMLLTESNTSNDDFDDDEEGAAAQRRQRWTTFFNPTLLTNQPTLVAYVGGDDATAIESQTRNEIVEDVMTNLRSMFPDITNPDNVIVTRWGSEEDFYGAYAYPIAGRVFAEDATLLAEPIGRLYFAGEATSATRWGTTMGAWNTGEEQANAITARLLGW